jgi:glycosyltransferase involved in cell wall biosynthesis
MEARDKLGIKEENVLLNFGLIREYKGTHHLIEAFGMLPETVAKKTRLLIVGEEWDSFLDIKGRIEKNSYSDRITYLNEYIPDDEVKIYFSASDALVLPYLRSSGSGISLIGMAFSLPIIVSEIGALAENLSEYDGTYFIPPENPAKLAGILEKVLVGKRKQIKKPDIEWNKIALKYDELFNDIISGR